jgi:hypothetical protein
MFTDTRSQNKKRREGTIDTEELSRTEMTQIHQMMKNMTDQITEHVARQFSALSARLEKLKIQFIIASITSASITIASAMSISISGHASATSFMNVQPR